MRRRPKSIILHHSLTDDGKTVNWGAIRRYHVQDRGWRDVGYHFGIEDVNGFYEVLVGRPLGIQGAHTKGRNSRSIGICFVGNFDLAPPPLDQWSTGVRLVKSLLWAFSLEESDVYGHRDWADKSCPGKMFNMDAFRNLLRREE